MRRAVPSGAHIAETDKDGQIRLWDAVTGGLVNVLSGHTYAVYSVAFSPDGATLLSGGHDATVRVRDLSSGQARSTLRGHDMPRAHRRVLAEW
jgi:WD40 repeat protein